ncbi:probable tRNA (uracil-O(2)-)-methyltransferase [Trichogramma pretiosum]|uniref:probable tRNA (uracil-O(2)-)-methyltransferase n=1 Tax=Trichogramma pretiosum TaxID=7493 RepID=UPI0006C98E03|nr:probable tRNA (uracil-O(2)-)-methyltransferase [Trichogramma pretiosum]
MQNFHQLISKECSAGPANFWKASEILLKSPHLINRRILSSAQISVYRLRNVNSAEIYEWFVNQKKEITSPSNIEEELFTSLKSLANGNIELVKCSLEDVDFIHKDNESMYFRLAKLIPRHVNTFSNTLELSLIDLNSNILTFSFLNYDKEKKSLGFEYSYQIRYEKDNVSIHIQNIECWQENSNLSWFEDCFFPKLIKWIENDTPKNSLINGSLKLVSSEEYTDLYNNLKLKYGAEMIKIWPENTDPLKFVFEDVAIATYLLLLWETERKRLNLKNKQSFLDLGCGNGLLVHILNCEGHPGLGIDLRKRKIWDLYPESTHLEVKTIIPSSKSLFPETDWLIGNHSDELTPWIPVIAARSSYKCRFFLLPCCAYEFDGRKYQRESSSVSQYNDYMQYIKDVSENCGFKTDIDKLRIPSTKRICIIGTDRNYAPLDFESQDVKIQSIVSARSNGLQNEDSWSSTFKPRESVEKVRNCTKVNKDLISSIIEIVVSLLFHKARLISLENGKTWNAGGEIELAQVAKAVDTESLKQLKNECGGLQTLLRNNGNIFKIESGKVRFRVPGKETVGKKKKPKVSTVKRKIKDCWFHINHPDGCPLTDEECDFIHSHEKL